MDALRQSYERSNELLDPQNLFKFFSINGIVVQQPFAPIIFNILPKLYSGSAKYNMLDRWECRPDYCSYDIYGVTSLYWLIMYINGCVNATEFTKRRYNFIYAPSLKDVAELSIFVKINNSLI